MIKCVKYSASIILFLIYLVFCGETAYSDLTDKANEEFNNIYFERVYKNDELLPDIQNLVKKHNCFGYMIVYDYSDGYTEKYCCTKGDVDKVKRKLGIKDCRFNTILNGTYKLKFMEIEKFCSENNEEYIIQELMIDGDDNDVFELYKDFQEKYLVTLNNKTKAAGKSIYVGAACMIMVLLLGLYDVLNSKRSVCISLSLGNPLGGIILKESIKDLLVYAFTGMIITLVLSGFTATVLIKDKIIIYLVSLAVLNTILYFSLYFTNVCSSLKNENSSSAFMPINYSLKFISCCALILLVLFSGKVKELKSRYDCADDFRSRFSGFSRIELSESPYLAQQIDSYIPDEESSFVNNDVTSLIDKEFEEQKEYFRLLNNQGDVFFLNGFTYSDTKDIGKTRKIIVASDCAGEYITSCTGVELSEDCITVIIPGSYNLGDLHIAKKWIKMINKEKKKTTEIEHKEYKSANIAVFEYLSSETFITEDYTMNIVDSPIIIYFPRSADYDFFDYQSIQTNVAKNDAEAIVASNKLLTLFTDISTVGELSNNYMRKLYSEITVFVILFLSCIFYYLTAAFSIILLDIKLNKKERAISFSLGNGKGKRYIDILLKIIGSTVLAGAVSSFFAIELGIFKLDPIIISTAVIMIVELLVLSITAIINERNNTIRVLKGGAL